MTLDDLLDEYFSIGVKEGREGRDHDDIEGSAELTRAKIRACFADRQSSAALSAHPVGAVKALPDDASMIVQRLANSLAVFTKHYETWMDRWGDDEQSSTFSRHTFGELRQARKLIEEADARIRSALIGGDA